VNFKIDGVSSSISENNMTFGGFNNLVYILKLFKNYKMTNNELVPYACDQ
jgi:hypothetical protein